MENTLCSTVSEHKDENYLSLNIYVFVVYIQIRDGTDIHTVNGGKDHSH